MDDIQALQEKIVDLEKRIQALEFNYFYAPPDWGTCRHIVVAEDNTAGNRVQCILCGQVWTYGPAFKYEND